MQTVEALQARIESVERLGSLVRTMKALSAAGIRRCEEAVASLVDYSRSIETGMAIVLDRGETEAPDPVRWRRGPLAVVVFGCDQGLCGRFNDQVASYAMRAMDGLEPARERRAVLSVGRRLAGRLEDLGQPVAESLPVPGSPPGITPLVQELLIRIEAWRERRGVERVVLIHLRHRPGGPHDPETVPFLPVDLARFRLARRRPSRTLPMYTMDRRRLLSALIRQYLFVTLFRACAESLASEHALRLMSLQGVEKNIEGRLEELRGAWRRLRQDITTEEILDVNAGFIVLTEEERDRRLGGGTAAIGRDEDHDGTWRGAGALV